MNYDGPASSYMYIVFVFLQSPIFDGFLIVLND